MIVVFNKKKNLILVFLSFRVLLTSVPMTFFKDYKIRNYSLHKSNILILSALVIQSYLKLLNSVSVTLINIFLSFNMYTLQSLL